MQRTAIKKAALFTLGVGVIGLSALKLPGAVERLSDPSQKIPADVERLLYLTSRITEEGEIINGAWVARERSDQNLIDSGCYVVDYLRRSNKQMFNAPKIAAVLDQQLLALEQGLVLRRDKFGVTEQGQLAVLCDSLQGLRLRRECAEKDTALSIEKFCAPFRVINLSELNAMRTKAAEQLENVSYLGLPDL